MKKIFFSLVLLLSIVDFLFAIPKLVLQEGHGYGVFNLHYSRDGKYLYSVGFSSADIKVWDVESGFLIKTYNNIRTDSKINAPVFSPDENFFLWQTDYYGKGEYNDIVLVNMNNNESSIIDKTEKGYSNFAFSSSGNFFAVSDGNKIKVYSMKKLKKQFLFLGEDVKNYGKLIFSNDSNYIIAEKYNLNEKRVEIDIWNIGTESKVESFSVEYEDYPNDIFALRIEAIGISSDDRYVITALNDIIYCKDSLITVYDRVEKKIINRWHIEDRCTDLQCTKNNDVYAVYGNILDQSSSGYLGVWNINSENQIYKERLSSIPASLALSPDEKHFVIGFNDGHIEKHSINLDKKKIYEFSETSDFRKNISIVNSSEVIIIPSYNRNGFYVFDKFLKSRGFIDLDRMNLVKSDCSVTDKGIFCKKSDNSICCFDSLSQKEIESFVLKNVGDKKFRFIVDKKGDKLVYFFDDEPSTLYFYNIETNSISASIYDAYVDKKSNNYFSISSSGKYVVVQNYSDEFVKIYDFYSGQIKKQFNGNLRNVSFSDDDSVCFLSFFSSEISGIYNTSDWTTKEVYHYSWNKGFVSPDGMHFTVDDDGKLMKVFETKSGKMSASIEIPLSNWHSTNSDLNFIFDDSCIIFVDNKGIIRCYSIKEAKLLASTVCDARDNWLTYVPEGYFFGTEEGIEKFVHIVDDMKVYSLNQLRETFLRPDLIASRLQGSSISELSTSRINKSKKKVSGDQSIIEQIVSTGDAPLVQFVNNPSSSSNRDITVNFSVQDQGGGIGTVYLSHNGKVMQISKETRKLVLQQTDKTVQNQSSTVQFSQTISLSDGENIIEAYATNSAGKIESRHASTIITWHGEMARPNLFVLALGVNDYRADSVSKLKYAVPDAISVVNTFAEKAISINLYKSVTTRLLVDKRVTKPLIENEIEQLSKSVKPDDVFVFYISGHGTAYNGDYYFISYDFDGKDINTAVSKDFILEQLSKISASKTVLLLDTCNSGAIINGAGGDSDTAFARLSHKTGQAIIAASSDTQTAIEGYDGHGVFTYAVLDALSGKADFVSDNQISLLELNLYVSNIVPMLSKLKWNHAQNPWYDLRKQDFVLVGK